MQVKADIDVEIYHKHVWMTDKYRRCCLDADTVGDFPTRRLHRALAQNSLHARNGRCA